MSYPIDKTLSEFVLNIQDKLKIIEAKELTIEEFWQNIQKTIVKKEYDYKKDFGGFINSLLNNRSFP